MEVFCAFLFDVVVSFVSFVLRICRKLDLRMRECSLVRTLTLVGITFIIFFLFRQMLSISLSAKMFHYVSQSPQYARQIRWRCALSVFYR